MISPKKKLKTQKTKKISVFPVNNDPSNFSMDSEISKLSNYIQNKITSGILPQDITLSINPKHYLEILKYIFSKHYRNKNEITLIKHYLSSFKRFQNKSVKSFDDPNELINKVPLCLKFEAINANTSVCLLGEIGDKFYFIFKGSVGVLIPSQYQSELTEKEYMEYLKKLYSIQEFDILERTIAANRHMYLSPEMYDLMNQVEEQQQNMQKVECNVEQYIERVKPDLAAPPIGKRSHVTLWTYKMVCALPEGASFGDVALKGEAGKRTATILTIQDCYFGSIKKDAYEICIKESLDKIRKQNIDNIYSHAIFKGYSHDYFEKNFFNLFKLEQYQQGQFIFKQGDKREMIFFLKRGEIEITVNGNFITLNSMINELGGNNDKTIEDKQYSEILRHSSFFSTFYNKIRTFRIVNINKNDIIGLDDFIYKGKFGFGARVTSESCSVFCLEQHFFDEILKQKKINENITSEVAIRKAGMINRIKNIKTIFVKKFYSNLEKDFLEQQEQMEKEATTYIQYKKNTKTLKQQKIISKSSFGNTSNTNNNNTNPNLVLSLNTNSNNMLFNRRKSNILLTEISLRKKKQQHYKTQQQSYFSLSSQNNPNSKSSNSVYKNRIVNSSPGNSKGKTVKTNLEILKNKNKKMKITLKDAKLIGISPFFINSFYTTNPNTNPHINELYLLKKIKMQNEIVGKLHNKLQISNNDKIKNTNIDKTGKINVSNTIGNDEKDKYAHLDFLAFDNYVEKVENKCLKNQEMIKEKLKPIYKSKIKIVKTLIQS